MALSAVSVATLELAGWTPHRQVDVSPYVESLTAEGFSPGGRAIAFLQRFGGLRLKCRHRSDPTSLKETHFDAQGAMRGVGLGWVRGVENCYKLLVTVVGNSDDDYCTVLFADTGRMFSILQDWHWDLGQNEVEGLNNLCDGVPLCSIEYNNIRLRDLERATDDVSDFTMQQLLKAGWSATHAHDLAEPRRRVGSDGLSNDHPAFRFIHRFGGLTLSVPRAQGLDDVKTYTFTLASINEFVPQEVVEKVEYDMDQRFAVIGCDSEREEVLCMADGGGVFLIPLRRPKVLWCIGGTGADALNGLVVGRSAVRI
jgi:hypothetical protein